MIAEGRSAVSLRAAAGVCGQLEESDCWAVLAGAASALQDRLLAGAGLPALLVCPDSLLLTSAGTVQLGRAGGCLHPEAGAGARPHTKADLERLSVYSLGVTVGGLGAGQGAGLDSLLTRMSDPRLGSVPGLLYVLQKVEQYWRGAGGGPGCQRVARLCQATLTRSGQVRPATQFSRLNTSSSSSSASTEELPKPPGVLPGLAASSPLGRSMPSLLERQTGLYSQARRPPGPHRRYGRRLGEFRHVAPLTGRLARRAGAGLGDRSLSQDCLLELQQGGEPRPARPARPPHHNPHRLYRVVRPLVGVAESSESPARCVGPEFVVRSGLPVEEVEGRGRVTVLLVLLTGQRLQLSLQPAATAAQLLATAAEYLRLAGPDRPRFCLALRDGSEWLPVSAGSRVGKFVGGGAREGVCSLTLYHRLLLLPDTVHQLAAPASHLLYLQLRQDALEGRYRAEVGLHLALAATALHAEFGSFLAEIHGSGPYFSVEHYLPGPVVQLLGERQARARLQALHRARQPGELPAANTSFCHTVTQLKDYGFFFYTGREAKKLDSLSTFFAIHVRGVHLFESSRNMFKPPTEIRSYAWEAIKEVQYSSSKLQLVLHPESSAGGPGKLKVYLTASKARRVCELAALFHRQQQESSGKPGRPDTRLRAVLSRAVRRYGRVPPRPARPATRTPLSLKRSSSGPGPAAVPVRRLTHYTSMAGEAGSGDTAQPDSQYR